MTIAGILKTKLGAIDADCEACGISEIDKLYAEARYDGSRFRVPSFQAAGKLWIELIEKKEREFIKEITRILGSPGVILDAKAESDIRSLVEDVFAETLYLERMRIFSESIGRKAQSYGLVFDSASHRIGIYQAAYRAGAKNALRKARANVFAEVELLAHSNVPEVLRSLYRWRSYLKAHPWIALGAIALMVIWGLVSKVGVADLLMLLHG